jgi:hypothetical protein
MSQGSLFCSTFGIFNVVLSIVSKYAQKYSVRHWLLNFVYSISLFSAGNKAFSRAIRYGLDGPKSKPGEARFSVQTAPRITQRPVK